MENFQPVPFLLVPSVAYQLQAKCCHFDNVEIQMSRDVFCSHNLISSWSGYYKQYPEDANDYRPVARDRYQEFYRQG